MLSAFGTRLEIGQLTVTVALGDNRAEVGVVARQSALVVRRGDGDGFVRSLLPESGLRLAFELGVALRLHPEAVPAPGGWQRVAGDAAVRPGARPGPPATAVPRARRRLEDRPPAGCASRRRWPPALASVRSTAGVDRVGFELTVDTEGGTPPHVGFKPPSGIGLVDRRLDRHRRRLPVPRSRQAAVRRRAAARLQGHHAAGRRAAHHAAPRTSAATRCW